MNKPLKLILMFCALLPSMSASIAAQTVELSTRTFWLNERPNTLDSYPPFIAPDRIDWIDKLLEIDPALQKTVFHIEKSFVPMSDNISRASDRYILLNADRVPSRYRLEEYEIYGSEMPTATDFTYIPIDPSAGYFTWCSQTSDRARLNLCVVYANYSPDDSIQLKARLYFPPDPIDRPNYFRDVAVRMREVAHCLDVTEKPGHVPVDHNGDWTCDYKPDA